MGQVGLKVNDQEKKELEQLKELLNLKDAFGGDSQAYKQAVRLAIEYLNKVKPYFVLYELLYLNDKQKLYSGTHAKKKEEFFAGIGTGYI